MTDELILRRMAAADVPAVTNLHSLAFAGSMGVSLGERYVNAFLLWFIDDPTGEAVVAVKAGEVVGYVCGADDGYNTRQNRALFRDIVGGLISHPRVLMHKNFLPQLPNRIATLISPRTAARVAPVVPTGPDVFDLVGIGVSPLVRGAGVGKKLIAAFADRVFARRQLQRIILSVYDDNVAARRLYEACRFDEVGREGRVVYYALTRPH